MGITTGGMLGCLSQLFDSLVLRSLKRENAQPRPTQQLKDTWSRLSILACQQIRARVLPKVNRGRRPVEVFVPVGGDDQLVAAANPASFAVANRGLPRRREVHRRKGGGISIVARLFAESVIEEQDAPAKRSSTDRSVVVVVVVAALLLSVVKCSRSFSISPTVESKNAAQARANVDMTVTITEG